MGTPISEPSRIYVVGNNKAHIYSALGQRYITIMVKAGKEIYPLTLLKRNVDFFLKIANNNPDEMYYVTRIGIPTYWTDYDVATMFYDAPKNCTLPECWKGMVSEVEGRGYWKC